MEDLLRLSSLQDLVRRFLLTKGPLALAEGTPNVAGASHGTYFS